MHISHSLVYKPPVCSSPLCNYQSLIKGFARNHGDEIDLEEYDDKSQELLEALNQADFLAYSALFADYGNGGGGKGNFIFYYDYYDHNFIIQDYIADSHKQIKRSVKSLEEIIKIIGPTN